MGCNSFKCEKNDTDNRHKLKITVKRIQRYYSIITKRFFCVISGCFLSRLA